MVHLMLQPVFLDISRGLMSGGRQIDESDLPAHGYNAIEPAITCDELYQMWSVAKKAKSAIAHGYRLENLAWRLWYASTLRSRFGHQHHSPIPDAQEIRINSSGPEHSANEPKMLIRENCTSTFIVPSGNKGPLAAAYTSILAEIQDAAIRQRPSFFHSIGHGVEVAEVRNIPTSHAGPQQPSHHPSPPSYSQLRPFSPAQRRPPPATGINIAPASLGSNAPKRKKNIDKFLKKYRTNLEGISEFNDGENAHQNNDEPELEGKSNQGQMALSPDDRSTLTVSDDSGNETAHSQASAHGFFNNISTASIPPQKTPSIPFVATGQGRSMLSRIFRAEDEEHLQPSPMQTRQSSFISDPDLSESPPMQNAASFSTGTFVDTLPTSMLTSRSSMQPSATVMPEPRNRPSAAFLDLSTSGSLLSNQLELMALNRYDRYSTESVRSPSLLMAGPTDNALPAPAGAHLKGHVAFNRSRSSLDLKSSKSPITSTPSLSKASIDEDLDMSVTIW